MAMVRARWRPVVPWAMFARPHGLAAAMAREWWRPVALAIAAALVAGCATARSAPAGPAATVTRDVLPNGLVVIVQEHRSADVVALQLWIGVGGRDEAPSERGYSHFVEHMVFKGTESRPRGFTDQEVEAVGGRTNAATSNDYRRTNSRIAWYAAFFENAGVGFDFPSRYVRAVQAVSVADVGRAAQRYLASPAMVTVGPAGK